MKPNSVLTGTEMSGVENKPGLHAIGLWAGCILWLESDTYDREAKDSTVGTPGVLYPVASRPSVVVEMFRTPYLVFHDNRFPVRLTVPWGDINSLSFCTIDAAVYIAGGIVMMVGAFNVLSSNWLVVDVIFWKVFWN